MFYFRHDERFELDGDRDRGKIREEGERRREQACEDYDKFSIHTLTVAAGAYR
jgi:hypothetical protein